MATIMDAVYVPRNVQTKKYGELEVTGISIEGIVSLIKEHPRLIELFKGESMTIQIKDILDLGVDVASSFLAAGLGAPGNKEAIQKCRTMNPEDAWDIGQAILDESFPGGAANFFQKVASLSEKAQGLLQATPASKNKEEENKEIVS